MQSCEAANGTPRQNHESLQLSAHSSPPTPARFGALLWIGWLSAIARVLGLGSMCSLFWETTPWDDSVWDSSWNRIPGIWEATSPPPPPRPKLRACWQAAMSTWVQPERQVRRNSSLCKWPFTKMSLYRSTRLWRSFDNMQWAKAPMTL